MKKEEKSFIALYLYYKNLNCYHKIQSIEYHYYRGFPLNIFLEKCDILKEVENTKYPRNIICD